MKTFEYFKTEALKYKLNFQAKRISLENFESSCKLCEAVTEKTLFNQNSKSDKIYFLKSGKIKFYKINFSVIFVSIYFLGIIYFFLDLRYLRS